MHRTSKSPTIRNLMTLCIAAALAAALAAPVLGGATAFRTAPSYFIANTPAASGKRLVADEAVTAFLQTASGRVVFGPEGAMFAIAVPESDDRAGAEGVSRHHGRRSILPAKGEGPAPVRQVLLRAGFESSNQRKGSPAIRLEQATGAVVNFLRGPKEEWRTGLPTYRRLVYENAWDGIDLEYLGFMDRLEFRLVVRPGARPADIAMATGADALQLLDDGSMVASRAGGELTLSAPIAYQESDSGRVAVPVSYVPLEGGRYGFALGGYDRTRPLVIDPVLRWGTFIHGGAGDNDFCAGISVDSAGCAYIAGNTRSAEVPTTPGADDTLYGGNQDVYLAKFAANGQSLVYCTYIGGAGEDAAGDIAVDSVGAAFVCGRTSSADFPVTTGAYDTTLGGTSDAFVVKFNTAGSNLVYATYLGGSDRDGAAGIAVWDNRAYVTGATESTDFPTTTGAYDRTYYANRDVFVTKLHTDGTVLSYSTYIGGQGLDEGADIAVQDNCAYITGYSYSKTLPMESHYPTTPGVVQPVHAGDWDTENNSDVIVTKLNDLGSALVYSTFLGGAPIEEQGHTGDDFGYGIAVQDGCAYVTGCTDSVDFPSTAGAYDPVFNGNEDAFVAKLNTTATSLTYSTFLGNGRGDQGNGIAVSGGVAYVAGTTSAAATPFPTTPGAYDTTPNNGEGFLVKMSTDGASLLLGTFVGGMMSEGATGVAVLDNYAYVCGSTESADFPTTAGAFQTVHKGYFDAFITKFNVAGSALEYSTLFGFPMKENGYDVAVEDGYVYLTGTASASEFGSGASGYDQYPNGDTDAFALKLSREGDDLLWWTFLGGSAKENGRAIGVSDGYAYVTGTTTSTDFPTTAGVVDTTANGLTDVFVAKLAQDGRTLEYSTYLGGSSNDYAYDLAVDGATAYVAGATMSAGFPTSINAYDTSHNGHYDAFVTALSGLGNALVFSTFIGGSAADYAYGIALDASANVYIAGETNDGATDFPTTAGAFQTAHAGQYDAFVAKLLSTGTWLLASTLYGTSNIESAQGLAVSADGKPYIVGAAHSNDMSVTDDAFQSTLNGTQDAYLAVFSADLTTLEYATFFGGSGSDVAWSVDEEQGIAYFAGSTGSTDLPATEGAWDSTANGGTDGFVARLRPGDTRWTYASYLGGAAGEDIRSIVTEGGRAYLTGQTSSPDFPVTPGVYAEDWYAQAVFACYFKFCLADLDLDGQDTSLDLCTLLHYLVNHLDPGDAPFNAPLFAADATGDGAVNAQDLILLANSLAGNPVP